MAYITIDAMALKHNLNTLCLKAGTKERIAIVLKDNAYGHGLEIIAKLASLEGIKRAVVRTLHEAYRIEEYFEDILILNDTPIVHKKFRFAINSIDTLLKAPKGVRVDIKVDTGMYRNGIKEDELERALEIAHTQGLKVAGIMSHFRSSDLLSSEYLWQKKRFEAIKKRILRLGLSLQFHSHNSAGLLRCETFDEDFARVGIAVYGLEPLEEIFGSFDLKPVMALFARKITTHTLKKGSRIGYGGEFEAPKQMEVSIYDIGYGDGWRRGDTAHPYRLPNGKEILGRVSMDSIAVEGDEDEVCLFCDAQKTAQHFGTIGYEVLTALSPSIKRIVINGKAP